MNQIPVISQLLDVICRTTGMEFSAIAKVTGNHLVICAANDKNPLCLQPGDQLKLEFPHLSPELHETEVFYDQMTGTALMEHQVPGIYELQSFVSVPVKRQDGGFFGILCAMHSKPAKVTTPEVKGMFQLFANLISFHLQALDNIKADTTKVEVDLNNSRLRDQIIAILGHDLKNPIATMRMSSDILLKFSKEDLVLRQAKMIKSSSFRMEGLIDNILDYAREQMGEGINPLKKSDSESLQKSLEQVVREIQTISPNRPIHVNIDLNEEISGDENRISQLFSNLMAYADIHGYEKDPIEAIVITENGEFQMSVKNNRVKISDQEMSEIFQPFFQVDEDKIGLNLGLHISSEIAKAHNGTLTVESTDEETLFNFKMPVN